MGSVVRYAFGFVNVFVCTASTSNERKTILIVNDVKFIDWDLL